MCHLVLLLPLFGLTVFWLWPPAVAVPVYLVVLAVSAGVYYLTFVAMRLPVTVGREALAGTRGKVVSVDSGELRVRAQSEVWRASASEKLRLGDPVEVRGIDGLTLKVKRIGEGAQSKGADQRRGSAGEPHRAYPADGLG
jgi:membrane protein implicated in regulation of membrane protease activity